MSTTSYSFTVKQENDGSTLRTFLRRSCGITARTMTLIKYSEGGIFRNEMLLMPHDIVHAGETIILNLPSEENDIIPVGGDLDILFEDDTLLVVNKPADMPVHPTKRHQLDTLANIVSYHQRDRGESYVFRALNRLDKDTSGCVMIAKDRLCCALVKNSVRKTYVAVCEGVITEGGVIDAPIGLEQGSKIKRFVRADGAVAVTRYRPITCGNGHTLLELCLETGRTHQIRCHMSHIGHPLAGDDLYGGNTDRIRRQALHCRDIRFIHPRTNEETFLQAETPEAFFEIIKEG